MLTYNKELWKFWSYKRVLLCTRTVPGCVRDTWGWVLAARVVVDASVADRS